MLVAVYLIFLMLHEITALSAPVGHFCTLSSECGSPLLYCSSNGVCLCALDRANQVYEFKTRSSMGVPKCEVLSCSLSEKGKDCNLRDAQCIPNPSNRSSGYCKCPHHQTGVRRTGGYASEYTDYCKSVEFTNVGQWCSLMIMNFKFCDLNRRLKCSDQGCECHDDYIYSNEEDICKKKDYFIEKYGYAKIGAYGEYCRSYEDCNGGMSCQNKKCDCPYSCGTDIEAVKTDELCYCPFNPLILLTILAGVVPLVLLIGLVYFVKRRQMQQMQQFATNNIVIMQNVAGQPTAATYQLTNLQPVNAAGASLMMNQQQSPAAMQQQLMHQQQSPAAMQQQLMHQQQFPAAMQQQLMYQQQSPAAMQQLMYQQQSPAAMQQQLMHQQQSPAAMQPLMHTNTYVPEQAAPRMSDEPPPYSSVCKPFNNV